MALVPVGSGALCILPNLQKHSINWPHQVCDGILIQTKTVRTVVRVGQLLPAAAMRLTMSLHDASGEITPNRVTTGRPMYNGLSNSITQEMRPEVPLQDESDDGVARGACVAEATFDFKFSVTATQVAGGTKDTLVWLRFIVDGSPNLYVETLPFRLLAKKDNERDSVKTLVVSAIEAAKQVSADLGKAIAMPAESAADQQIINDCLGLEQQLRARLQQHSAFNGTNGAGALVTGGAAAAAVATPLLQGGPSVVQGGDDPSGAALAQWNDRNRQVSVEPLADEDELQELINDVAYEQTPEGAALRAALMGNLEGRLVQYVASQQGSRKRPSSSDGDDDDDTAPPPTSRQRTEGPSSSGAFFTSLGASAEADDAPPAATYCGLGAGEDTPQYQSASASDADHAPPPPAFRSLGGDNQVTSPAFRSLGADEEVDEPVLRSAATPAATAAPPAAAEVAPSPRRRAAPLAPSLRAAAMTKLVAIAREMLRQRRDKGGAAGAAAVGAAAGAAAGVAAGVSSMAEELEDLRQWIRFHRG